jgi:hypothetical protein
MVIKLFISVASNRDWKSRFAICLTNLWGRLARQGIAGHNLEKLDLRCFTQASCLSVGRQFLLDEALAGGYTHMFNLDDDIVFPEDIVDRLLAKDKAVVSINLLKKSDEFCPLVTDKNGTPISSIGRTGIEEITSMPMAGTLINLDAIRHVERPHFQVLWDEAKKSYIGEDVYFSTLLRINHVTLWVDHDVSQDISHIGTKEYSFDSFIKSIKVAA